MFITFLMIGFVSFGGGYAMIPLIEREVVERHGWMTLEYFSDVIAVAGMSPGPIATNIAIFIGFQQAGMPGAVIAALGMVLPSLAIILILGMVFFKIQQHKLVKSSFYGLRTVITGLIVYAAIMFAINNNILGPLNWFTASQILIFLGSLAALMMFRKHPLLVIAASGVIGMAIYS
ncbi:chromate transporter [Paenibacillus sp. 1P07SE]|uniref:chromate transporter n=1 Tax=Paenibacillus sp. 1P07SE TaxID=3132209 RepID=UPI0039A66EDE